MYTITPSEARLMKDLVKELSEFNSYVRSGAVPFGHEYMQGNYFYAFDPGDGTEREVYQKNIKLLSTINDMLDENCINIKSQGYTFIKDAICIVTDRRSLDICLNKEIYPLIADKHRIKTPSAVEHGIRNAIDSAYKKCREKYPERDCIMNSFEYKPTTKKFLLRAVQEVSRRLLKELSL